jgi:hypothetical protein
MTYRVASWGAGVQSTTMIEMSIAGILPSLDVVINADPGWERSATYQIRQWYAHRWHRMGLAVEIIPTGDIRTQGATEHIHIPFWTSTGGPLRRQCTRDFKIRPQRRRVRELLGFHPTKPPAPPAGAVEKWIGFSLDEWYRMEDSNVQFIVNRWPLIDLRMSRQDCIDWLQDHDLPVPVKSACICCPYRSAVEWIEMRDQDPDEFEDACLFDEENRHNPLADQGKVKSPELYIWRDTRSIPGPLRTADLEENAARAKQGTQLPLLICNGADCWT